jgi:hypothetical protein
LVRVDFGPFIRHAYDDLHDDNQAEDQFCSNVEDNYCVIFAIFQLQQSLRPTHRHQQQADQVYQNEKYLHEEYQDRLCVDVRLEVRRRRWGLRSIHPLV